MLSLSLCVFIFYFQKVTWCILKIWFRSVQLWILNGSNLQLPFSTSTSTFLGDGHTALLCAVCVPLEIQTFFWELVVGAPKYVCCEKERENAHTHTHTHTQKKQDRIFQCTYYLHPRNKERDRREGGGAEDELRFSGR